MNEHPHDLLPAFALGALDADEASQVLRHVAVCAACRADIEAFGVIVGLLPYAVAPQAPPADIKRRLFAMIDMSAQPGPGARPTMPGPRVGAGRWMGAAATCSLALALVLGLLFTNERGRAETLTAQLGGRDQTIQQINNQLGERTLAIQRLTAQLNQERQETIFVSTAIGQPLKGAQAGAEGRMYIKPGSTHAVLVIRGLKPPAAGKVYQLWLATADKQVPLATFTVGSNGVAMLAIDAPTPVDGYVQVLVTVEPASGSQSPSDEIVLRATL